MEDQHKLLKKIQKDPKLFQALKNLSTMNNTDSTKNASEKLRERLNNIKSTRLSKSSKIYIKDKKIQLEKDKLEETKLNEPSAEETIKNKIILEQQKQTQRLKQKLKKLTMKYGNISDSMYQESLHLLNSSNDLTDDIKNHHKNIVQLYLKQNQTSKKIVLSDDSDSDSDNDNNNDNNE